MRREKGTSEAGVRLGRPIDSQRNIEDYWNVDGDRELSDAWTGFRMDIHGPGGD